MTPEQHEELLKEIRMMHGTIYASHAILRKVIFVCAAGGVAIWVVYPIMMGIIKLLS
jgi:hypothetical protein